MTAEDYIKQAMIDGRLTYSHIAKLVADFQMDYKLEPDGKPGPKTMVLLDEDVVSPRVWSSVREPFLYHPLPKLPDGRIAKITSSFRPKDRVDHDGLDFFYEWKKGDLPAFVGDKGATSKRATGEPKWVVPYEVYALAAADGVVQIAGSSPTGYRLWIDHGNGLRTGYFHLLDLNVSVGQSVSRGKMLGLVGDNPRDDDGRHLHFELSPVEKYAPMNPVPLFLKGALS